VAPRQVCYTAQSRDNISHRVKCYLYVVVPIIACIVEQVLVEHQPVVQAQAAHRPVVQALAAQAAVPALVEGRAPLHTMCANQTLSASSTTSGACKEIHIGATGSGVTTVTSERPQWLQAVMFRVHAVIFKLKLVSCHRHDWDGIWNRHCK
jgi:hypothetical protein